MNQSSMFLSNTELLLSHPCNPVILPVTSNYRTSTLKPDELAANNEQEAVVEQLAHLVLGDLLANLLEVSLGEDESHVSLQSAAAEAPN
jgi:hypothetical protein